MIFDTVSLQENLNDLVVTQAEQSVLGALLHSNVSYKIYAKNSYLQADHFANEFHRRIYAAYQEIEEETQATDEKKSIGPFSIKNRLALNKDDAEYVVKLCNLAGSVVSYREYATAIVESYKKRKALSDLFEKIDDYQKINSEEVIRHLKGICEGLEDITPSKKSIKSNEVGYKIVESLGKPRKIYSTGMKALDNAMSGGLVAGKMYGICARKKTGKTVLSGTLAYNLAKQGIETLFIACEMSEEELQQRIIARDIGRNCGIFLYEDVIKFKHEIERSVANDQGKLTYHDGKCITFDRLKIEMNRAYNTLKTKVFILDYLQLIGGKNYRQSDAAFLDEVSQWLAEFFLATETVGIVIAQMNQTGNVRGGEGIRLACSQCYELKKSDNMLFLGGQQTQGYYMEMMDTRYTPWIDVGTEEMPILVMDNVGPHFREVM